MSDEKVEVSLDGLARLRSAARDFARAEIERVVDAVIAELRSWDATGIFPDVGARHMWDEYCWNIQQGPFDDDEFFGELDFVVSVSGAWTHTIRPFVADHVTNLPKHALVFLSAYAAEEDDDSDEDDSLGSICVDGIVDLIMHEIGHRASQRSLDLIGPDRALHIGGEIEGSGTVWSTLSDRGEATEILAFHTDVMIHPDGDLSDLASPRVYQLAASLPDAPLRTFQSKVKDLPKATDAERLVIQRIGQDIFRAGLMDYWQGRCPMTGITDPALLRASHIIPWKDCKSDSERLIVHNGLLLSALWDAAFDRGLVTFDDEGRPEFSPALSETARAELRWQDPIPLTDKHKQRLTWHRTHHFMNEPL